MYLFFIVNALSLLCGSESFVLLVDVGKNIPLSRGEMNTLGWINMIDPISPQITPRRDSLHKSLQGEILSTILAYHERISLLDLILKWLSHLL